MEKNVIIKVTEIKRDIFKSGKIISLEGITKHNKIVGIGNIKDIMNHDYFYPHGTYLKVSYDEIIFHKDIIYTIKATNIMPMKVQGNKLIIDNNIDKYYDILD